jgi:biotin-(acetyl-CoA carboxylase) ligase
LCRQKLPCPIIKTFLRYGQSYWKYDHPASGNRIYQQLCQHPVQTNDYPEGTVFLAYSQTAGRGQINNKWESEPGKNLTFSILFYPDFLEIRDQFMLSKVVSLGIRRTLAQYIDDVSIKWPNDIYAGTEKSAGS